MRPSGCWKMTHAFGQASERASSRPTEVSSSKKKKWTPALNECSSRDADSLDARSRGGLGAHQELSHRAPPPVCAVHCDRALRNYSLPEGLITSRTTGTRRRNSRTRIVAPALYCRVPHQGAGHRNSTHLPRRTEPSLRQQARKQIPRFARNDNPRKCPSNRQRPAQV